MKKDNSVVSRNVRVMLALQRVPCNGHFNDKRSKLLIMGADNEPLTLCNAHF